MDSIGFSDLALFFICNMVFVVGVFGLAFTHVMVVFFGFFFVMG